LGSLKKETKDCVTDHAMNPEMSSGTKGHKKLTWKFIRRITPVSRKKRQNPRSNSTVEALGGQNKKGNGCLISQKWDTVSKKKRGAKRRKEVPSFMM